MRAAVVASNGAFQVENVPDPVPTPGQLVIRVTGCGICGTDLSAHTAMPNGTIMGHEFSGEVVAVGAGATGAWQNGMHIVALPVFSCGACEWCRVGEPSHCTAATLIGLGGTPGGFAEYMAVDADLAFRLPDALAVSYGSLVEPFAVGLHTAHVGAIGPDDEVLVIGGGPVGLTTVAWANQLGARRITLSDPHESRLTAAMVMGATDTVKARQQDIEGTYDVVIECVGKPGMIDACVAAVRKKGRIVVAGVCAQPDPFLPVVALLKEVSIGFSVYYRRDEFQTVIDSFETERIDPSPLLTRTVTLDELSAAFTALKATRDDVKVVVNPQM